MGNYRFIEGTVTSPMGFTAAGICASIKPSNKTKRDLALIYCDTPCTAAAVYTKNLVKSSAIEVTKKAPRRRHCTGCYRKFRQCKHLQRKRI